MNNIEEYPKCHMRTSLGNCDPIGGFCTSVNKAICEALHKVADRPTGEWVDHKYDGNGYDPKRRYECPNCGIPLGETEFDSIEYNFCPVCGAEIGVTKMPDRKRHCLYVMKGNVLYPVAYFTKEVFADMFWEEFQKFMEAGK